MPRARRYIATALMAIGLIVVSACSRGPSDSARQEEVAERGGEVMPFHLDKTTHVFKPFPNGGVQTVVVDEHSEVEQIKLIRGHLRKEARAFALGHFGDPERVHGDDMPGLEELRSSYREIEVSYSRTPLGGRIRYESGATRAVDALHRWFQAQLMDHGEDAQHGG